MRICSHITIFAAAFLMCLLSCNTLGVQDKGLVERNGAVSFYGSVGDPATRGENPMVGVGVYSIGVFAGYEEDDDTFGPASCANDYINNVKYSREHTDEPLAGEDICFWPFRGKLSFFAYTPYLSDLYLHPAEDYSIGFPRMEYTVTPSPTTQCDFCIANPVLDRHMTADPITLHFHHTLSQIVFSANFNGDIPVDHFIKIDNITLCNAIGTKTFTMNSSSAGYEWQSDDTCPEDSRTNYVLRRTEDASSQIANVVIPKASGSNFVDLYTQPGLMYLIPQSMTSGELYLIVDFSYYRKINGVDTAMLSSTRRVDLPSVEWLAGHKYRYKFSFTGSPSSQVSVSVVIEKWLDPQTPNDEHHIE